MGFSFRSPTYLVLNEPLQEESQVADRMSYGSLYPCLLISINLGSQTRHSADLHGWRGNSVKPWWTLIWLQSRVEEVSDGIKICLEDVPTQNPSLVGGLSLSFLWIRKRKGGRLILYYNLCKDGVFSERGEGSGQSSQGFLGICTPSTNPDHKLQPMVLHVTEMSAWRKFLCNPSLGSCVALVTWTKEEYCINKPGSHCGMYSSSK